MVVEVLRSNPYIKYITDKLISFKSIIMLSSFNTVYIIRNNSIIN